MKRRYDSNPDVDELLRWSGAGERIRQRKLEADEKVLMAALEEVGAQIEAEMLVEERKAKLEWRVICTVSVLFLIACVLLVIWFGK